MAELYREGVAEDGGGYDDTRSTGAVLMDSALLLFHSGRAIVGLVVSLALMGLAASTYFEDSARYKQLWAEGVRSIGEVTDTRQRNYEVQRGRKYFRRTEQRTTTDVRVRFVGTDGAMHETLLISSDEFKAGLEKGTQLRVVFNGTELSAEGDDKVRVYDERFLQREVG